MTSLVILSWVGSGLAVAVGLAALLRRRRGAVQWSFLVGMLVLAAEAWLSGMSYAALTPARIVDWQLWRLHAMSFLPGIWLVFSLSYSRGNQQDHLRRWRPFWLGILVLLPTFVILARSHLLVEIQPGTEPYQWHLKLGQTGIALFVTFLVTSILILMNFERTFRASVGTVRWRIKYMVIGLGLIFGVRFYTSSQTLIFTSINLWLSGLNVVALVLGLVLVALAIVRVGMASDDVYPSQRLIQYSLTGLMAGIYLLVVGVLAKLVTLWGGYTGFPVAAFFVLLAVVSLTVFLLSERARQHVRFWISRHLHRPYYDYRLVWAAFTRESATATNEDQLCRVVTKCTCDTLNVLSVNIWLLDEPRTQFRLAASTSIADVQAGKYMPVDEKADAFLEEFRKKPDPVRLGDSKAAWVQALSEFNPQFFPAGQERVCAPLVSGDHFLGLMTLTDRVNYLPFTEEDLDLLKNIAEQAAANLLNFALSKRLLEVKEMEAFQVMSAFFVHDLKNTASTLSLMVKNMPQHFDDPEFRQDALRGLTRSVDHINGLIQRLGLIREPLQMNLRPADLSATAQAALQQVLPPQGVRITTDFTPLPDVLHDPDQLQKVVVNLLNNALESVGPDGHVHLATLTRLNQPCLAVSDNGRGMSPEFMARSLFRPFQTTKNKGIGIGMFLSKRIVEAQDGRLEAESEPGRGTTFRIILPRKEPAA